MSRQAHRCIPIRVMTLAHTIALSVGSQVLIIAYAEARHEPTKTVYGWVPVGVVTNVIAKHGGMIGGTVPEGVAPLKGSESD